LATSPPWGSKTRRVEKGDLFVFVDWWGSHDVREVRSQRDSEDEEKPRGPRQAHDQKKWPTIPPDPGREIRIVHRERSPPSLQAEALLLGKL